MNKKIGVLGGMGSQATQYFFKKIIENTDADRDQDYPDMIIINQASLPDRTAIIQSGETEEFISMIERNLKILEFAQVDHIAITCNTSHFFFNKIQSKTKLPIINMVEETVKSIINNAIVKKIGILATDGTILTKIYENECIKNNIEAIIPSTESQKKIMNIIYKEIKAGEKGNFDSFMEVVEELRDKECDAIILACTELSYLKENHKMPEYCVDALDVLVRKTIELSGKKLKR